MKRILAIAMALLMLLCSILTFASCGSKSHGETPELELEDAADNLEDNDYQVDYIDDEDDLSVEVEAKLVAENFKGDRITITLYKDTSMAKLAYEKLELEHKQEIEELELQIKNYEHLIKTYDDDLKSSEIHLLEDMIEELEEKIEDLENYDNETFGRDGKYVWYGTPDAVEDTK